MKVLYVVAVTRRLLGLTVMAWVVLVFTAGALVACGDPLSDSESAVPPEFRPACGHPGSHVVVRKVPVTITHADCDLTGVAISYPGYGGATVPRRGGVGIGTSSGFRLTVDADTLDVTVNVTGPPGNA